MILSILSGNKARSSASASQKQNINAIYEHDLSYRNFSTGIGGRGNFSKATRAQEPEDFDVVQLLHNSRAPRVTGTQAKYHTGIGTSTRIQTPSTSVKLTVRSQVALQTSMRPLLKKSSRHGRTQNLLANGLCRKSPGVERARVTAAVAAARVTRALHEAALPIP